MLVLALLLVNNDEDDDDVDEDDGCDASEPFREMNSVVEMLPPTAVVVEVEVEVGWPCA